MGENIRAIEIKKRRLKAEMDKQNPNKKTIQGLRDSIKRHKKISRGMKYNRIKVKKRN